LRGPLSINALFYRFRLFLHHKKSREQSPCYNFKMTISIIVNDQIELTEVRENDKPSLIRYLNDTSIFNNTLMIPSPYTEASADFFINLCRKSEKNHGFIANFAIRERATGNLIGGCGRFVKDIHKDEIGYWLGEPFRHQGIMSAVINALCQQLFDTTDLIRIEAIVFSENMASAKTLEKADFQREGFLRKYVVKKGEMKDVFIFSKLK
jgi:[ribosomal protein S5]-alanine N-acetyltransferase